MKRRIVVVICSLALAFGLAAPVSAAAVPVSCLEKANTNSPYLRIDSLRPGNFNSCVDLLQSLLAQLNKECAAQPETPSKPEVPVKPETPVEPEVPVEPEAPVEPEVPVEPEAPIEVTPPVETPDEPDEQGGTFSAYAQQVLDLVNEQRAANGLSSLTLSSSLSTVAQAKAQDMKDNRYFSHTSPTYGSPFDMMKTFGITYRTAGENIAMGYATPKDVVNAWMNSSGHRANILNANYTQMGIGYVESGSYWCQMFIG